MEVTREGLPPYGDFVDTGISPLDEVLRLLV